MKRAHPFFLFALALLAWPAAAGAGRADFITNGVGKLGDYNLTLAYTPLSATHAILTVTLTNTSPAANGGFLTSFVFNNPHGDIAGASMTATNANFQLLGGPGFNKGVNGAPYGQFDFGASTFKSFEGGGNPARGIGVGQTAVFTFDLTGHDLNLLNEESFVDARSVGPGIGEGAQFFVGRFRGFLDGGSDKVPAIPHAPEPAGLALGAVGALGLLGGAWRLRRRGA